jgi:NADH pyrophosphatase NudC (nudix superfamily)
MRVDLQFAILMISTTGIGFLMMLSGVQKSLLDWRRRGRTCPACGRQIRNRTCSCTNS